MVKLYKGEYTALDLVEVANHPLYRTAISPFGMDGAGLVRYVGKAVFWKGRKIEGAAGMTPEEINRALGITRGSKGWPAESTKGGVGAGIHKIASVATDPDTKVPGVVLATIRGEDYKGREYVKTGIIPTRAARIAEKHGKRVKVHYGGLRVEDLLRKAGTTYPRQVVRIPIMV